MSKQQNGILNDNLLVLTLITAPMPKAIKHHFVATVLKDAHPVEVCKRLNALATMSNLLQAIKLYDLEFNFDAMINNF